MNLLAPLPSDVTRKEWLQRSLSFVRRLAESLLRRPSAESQQEQKNSPKNQI